MCCYILFPFLVFFWIISIFFIIPFPFYPLLATHFLFNYFWKRLKNRKKVLYVIPSISHSLLLFLLLYLPLLFQLTPICHSLSNFKILTPSASQDFDLCSFKSSVICVISSPHTVIRKPSPVHVICFYFLRDHSPVLPPTVHCLKTIISLILPVICLLIYSGQQMPWQLILQRQKLIFIYCF